MSAEPEKQEFTVEIWHTLGDFLMAADLSKVLDDGLSKRVSTIHVKSERGDGVVAFRNSS